MTQIGEKYVQGVLKLGEDTNVIHGPEGRILPGAVYFTEMIPYLRGNLKQIGIDFEGLAKYPLELKLVGSHVPEGSPWRFSSNGKNLASCTFSCKEEGDLPMERLMGHYISRRNREGYGLA
jgi:hypothetical protein